jgi:DNA replication protein DnaC
MQVVTKVCPVCGEPIERRISFPMFDGTGRREERLVRCACSCKRKEQEQIEERLRREENMRRLSQLRSLSLMDAKLKNVRFNTYQVNVFNQKMYDLARKYVANFDTMYRKGQGLLFYGEPGTGKSFTAAAIANELLDRMRPVVMTSFVKLIDELRRFNDDDTDMYLDRLNNADLLIVDDLGAERGTDFALEKVYDVIDSRYRSGKPMILTTNLELSYMRNCTDIRYNRIYDRIFEMCYPVKAQGKSWRKSEAVSRFDEMKKILEG